MTRGGIFVYNVISETLELIIVASLDPFRKPGLNLGITPYLQRVRIKEIPEVSFFSTRILDCE